MNLPSRPEVGNPWSNDVTYQTLSEMREAASAAKDAVALAMAEEIEALNARLGGHSGWNAYGPEVKAFMRRYNAAMEAAIAPMLAAYVALPAEQIQPSGDSTNYARLPVCVQINGRWVADCGRTPYAIKSFGWPMSRLESARYRLANGVKGDM